MLRFGMETMELSMNELRHASCPGVSLPVGACSTGSDGGVCRLGGSGANFESEEGGCTYPRVVVVSMRERDGRHRGGRPADRHDDLVLPCCGAGAWCSESEVDCLNPANLSLCPNKIRLGASDEARAGCCCWLPRLCSGVASWDWNTAGASSRSGKGTPCIGLPNEETKDNGCLEEVDCAKPKKLSVCPKSMPADVVDAGCACCCWTSRLESHVAIGDEDDTTGGTSRSPETMLPDVLNEGCEVRRAWSELPSNAGTGGICS